MPYELVFLPKSVFSVIPKVQSVLQKMCGLSGTNKQQGEVHIGIIILENVQ